MSTRVRAIEILRPGPPGEGMDPGQVAEIEAFKTRVDPGSAGTNRQTIRISGGVPRWRDEPNFFGRDYVTGDPTENASTGLAQLLADAHGGSGVGVHGGNIQLEEGEYRLTQTLDLTQWTGRIGGVGVGISPYYSTAAHHGRATVLRWDGPADQPVIRVRDSRDLILENFRIEGKDGVLASYGIEFNNPGGATSGTNEFLVVRDMHIGRYPWTRQGTNKGDVKSGIGFTGTNGNNDQFLIENVRVYYPTQYGLYVPNSQSVGGLGQHVIIYAPGVAGVHTGASIRFSDLQIFNYPIAIETVGDNLTVEVDGYVFEGGDMLARMSPHSSVLFTGAGYVQVNNTIAGGGVLVDWSPSGTGVLVMDNMRVTGNTTPASARIEIGPASPYTGNFAVRVKNAIGLHPDQLVFASGASMWAASPMSKGTIEWSSRHGNNQFQFRNELTQASGAGRTDLNKTAWDEPITDSGLMTRRRRTTVVHKTAAYNATPDDHVISVDASAGAVTIFLPSVATAAGASGRTFIIKKTNATNTVIVDANGSQTIDGTLTKTISSQYGWVEVVSNGTEWLVVGQGGTVA